jgi:hypothetical protein
VNATERAHILALDPRYRGDLPDLLEIFIGMPCIITENARTSLGVANGSRGTVVGMCFDPREPEIEPGVVSQSVFESTNFNPSLMVCTRQRPYYRIFRCVCCSSQTGPMA